MIQPPDHLSFQIVDTLLDGCEGAGEAAQLDEGTHDLDVYGDGPVAMEDSGEHGHPLLGENVWRVTTTASALV